MKKFLDAIIAFFSWHEGSNIKDHNTPRTSSPDESGIVKISYTMADGFTFSKGEYELLARELGLIEPEDFDRIKEIKDRMFLINENELERINTWDELTSRLLASYVEDPDTVLANQISARMLKLLTSNLFGGLPNIEEMVTILLCCTVGNPLRTYILEYITKTVESCDDYAKLIDCWNTFYWEGYFKEIVSMIESRMMAINLKELGSITDPDELEKRVNHSTDNSPLSEQIMSRMTDLGLHDEDTDDYP